MFWCHPLYFELTGKLAMLSIGINHVTHFFGSHCFVLDVRSKGIKYLYFLVTPDVSKSQIRTCGQEQWQQPGLAGSLLV